MIEITTALNDARLQAVVDFLAQGTTNATITLYSGDRPAIGAAPSGTSLVVIPLVEPAGTVSGGVLTLTSPPEEMVTTSGVATWARVANGKGIVAFDCDVSDEAGSGEITMQTTTLYAGGFARIVAGVLG